MNSPDDAGPLYVGILILALASVAIVGIVIVVAFLPT
jgi:hypothetical protein